MENPTMSVLGSIVSAIFSHAGSPAPASAGTPPSGAKAGAAPTSTVAAQTSPSITPSARPPGAASPVDVGAVMERLAGQSKEKLDWQKSIVDLMKLLGLDSSIAARKQLAQELHYAGNMNDTSSMNIWLHQQVMIKLAENGGKVPEALKH
jgi:hypothetical protein